MLKVEQQGAFLRLVYAKGGREAVAIGPASDLPTLLGLFVAQMAREGFSLEDICTALREVGEKTGFKPTSS
ncbi:hypothetical protein [Pyrobaculum calidifontis]|uniref:Uncharacterized protein n=1 Tax=Pyrobaculum calidifontis (strain DSM 21063 / JCM 11548 / VA1) TaxID=410359 RepID=A3MSS1_PYRCJ|nr:hypothetical protein [Pyrobaculum calidifontis]ABO07688.1 conserved hypothetical protein [Pyrobaculum calidifontis JCM 11548]